MLFLRIIQMIFLKIAEGSDCLLQIYNFPAGAARLTFVFFFFFFHLTL